MSEDEYRAALVVEERLVHMECRRGWKLSCSCIGASAGNSCESLIL